MRDRRDLARNVANGIADAAIQVALFTQGIPPTIASDAIRHVRVAARPAWNQVRTAVATRAHQVSVSLGL